jgi:hypothetical protein
VGYQFGLAGRNDLLTKLGAASPSGNGEGTGAKSGDS